MFCGETATARIRGVATRVKVDDPTIELLGQMGSRIS